MRLLMGVACVVFAAFAGACDLGDGENTSADGGAGGIGGGDGGGEVCHGAPQRVLGCVVGPSAPWLPDYPYVPEFVDISGTLTAKGNANADCFTFNQETAAVMSVNARSTEPSGMTWLTVEDGVASEVYTVGLLLPGLTDVFTVGSTIRIQANNQRGPIAGVETWMAVAQDGVMIAEMGSHTGTNAALKVRSGSDRCTVQNDGYCSTIIADMEVEYAGETRSVATGATETIGDIMFTNDAMSIADGAWDGCEPGQKYVRYGALYVR